MKYFILLATCVLALSTCRPEPPPPPGPSAPQKSLRDTIARTWVIRSAKENGNPTSDFNGNTITFSKGGSYRATSPLDTASGTWKFSTDETHVIFDSNAKPSELLSDWQILELRSNYFHWKWISGNETIEGEMTP